MKSFDQIEVRLVGGMNNAYEVAVASARTCYSGKGVIYPEEVSKDEKAIALRDRIASSTLEAGHLTTRQHAHFTFAISGVSRQFIWSFLHSHPFYNSEQVSQRYVKVKPDSFIVPPLSEAGKAVYLEAIQAQVTDYQSLIDILRPPLRADYYERFRSRVKYAAKWDPSVEKRLYEVARYVLGVGTSAYLYHTVSSLTLLRYARVRKHFETPTEQDIVVEKMLDCVRKIDPLFEKELDDPLPVEKTLEFQFLQNLTQKASTKFIEEFDRKLEGRTSRLVQYSPEAERILAEATRVALGRAESELSDGAALELILDPKNNPLLADTLNVATLDRLSQVLHHVHLTYYKKISHTADSQDQRHRTVLSSRPVLATHYTGKPDYVTPYGITQSPEALELYTKGMERTYTAINRLLEMGEKPEFAFYLLPNAAAVRLVSTGDLHGYQHKWKMRSCYNAQEEIFRATIDELEQLVAVAPAVGRHLRAPCYMRLRAGITPYCPEGDRYCGLPVWKYEISQYDRKSI